jgi:quercetin dioxygenase-like cupin family protein
MARHGKLALGALVLVVLTSTVDAGDYAGGVAAKVVLRTTTTSSGEKVTYPRTDRAEVTAMTVDIAPGTETGWHLHRAPVYAWVVSGSLTIEQEGGRRNAYKEGEPIVEAVGVLHNGKNDGTVPARLLVFYTGTEGAPNVERPPTRQ